MQRMFKRDISALATVFSFTEDFAQAQALDDAASFAMNVAIEELFTNMVKYGAKHENEVSLELKVRAGVLTIEMIDFDVEPFDVTKHGDVDTSKSLAERVPGGLGLHLVKSVMDDVVYDYRNRNARITMTKRLEGSDV